VGPYGYNLYNLDAGLVPPEEPEPQEPDPVVRTVSGLAWYDENGNGIRDAGEKRIKGARVTLYTENETIALDEDGFLVSRVTTGADGEYEFTNLRAGRFYVLFTGSSDFTIGDHDVSPKDMGGNDASDSDVTGRKTGTVLISAATDVFALPAETGPGGYHLRNLDAGFVRLEDEEAEEPDPVVRTVSGLAWYDANGNGIRDTGEAYVAGAIVTLRAENGDIAPDAEGNPVPAVTTGSDGKYTFANLSAGKFYVLFSGSAGFAVRNYNPSPKDRGGNDALDSDVTGTVINGVLQSAATDAFTLPVDTGPGGYHLYDIDAGFVPRPSGGEPGNSDPDPDPDPDPEDPGDDDPGEDDEPGEDEPDEEGPGLPGPSPGNSIVPGDGGTYIELDENGTPLGEWRYDEDNGEWIFDEYPPLGNLPQTGAVLANKGAEASAPQRTLLILGLAFLIAGLAGLRRRREES
jgi:hypothetical protein